MVDFKSKGAYSKPPFFSESKEYKKWLEEKIFEDSKSLPKFRKTSTKEIPMSWTRLPLYKSMIDEVFGIKCYICNRERRLELAHMFYAKNSSKEFNGNGSLKRIREALIYPERFRRLCRMCHKMFDTERKYGGVEFLDKLASLTIAADKYKEVEYGQL